MSNLKKIVPSDGMTLYNGDVLSKEIYLGASDSPENWVEITDAEADAIRASYMLPGYEPNSPTEADYLAALARLGVE